MKSGTARRPYCTRRLVDVEKRAADEEQWTQHEVGEEDGHPLAVVPLRVQEGAERVRSDADDDHERRERPERVDVVGGAELTSANEGIAEQKALHDGGRNREADEREPGEGR